MPRAARGRGRGGRGGFGGGSEPQWARDGRSIYFLQGGGIYTLAVSAAPAADTGGGGTAGAVAAADAAARAGGGSRLQPTPHPPAPAPRRIPFSVRMEIDIPAERRQVFEEAWRVMKNRFYDPKMHGVNWAAAKDKYEPLLRHIADTEELHNVIMEMIGEMNASHTGISGGSRLPGQGRRRRAHRRPATPASTSSPMPRGFYKVVLHLPQGPGRSRLRQARARQLHPRGQRQGTEDQRQLLEALQHPARAASSNSW